jgi:hypothetical protein
MGKESHIANARQKNFENEHSQRNAFVRKVQNEQGRHAGEHPRLNGAAQQFNAYMCNNGHHAQEFARELTAGLDKVAFPVD